MHYVTMYNTPLMISQIVVHHIFHKKDNKTVYNLITIAIYINSSSFVQLQCCSCGVVLLMLQIYHPH